MKKYSALMAAMLAACMLAGCDGVSHTSDTAVDKPQSGVESDPVQSGDDQLTSASDKDGESSNPAESTEQTTAESTPDDEPPAESSQPQEDIVPPPTSAATTSTAVPIEPDEPDEPVITDIEFVKSDEQLRLEQLVESNAGEPIGLVGEAEVLPLFFGDLDHDGTQELIAVYGTSYRDGNSTNWIHSGEVWFAAGENAERLDNSRTGEYVGFELISDTDGAFFSFEDFYVTGTLTNWWRIEGSTIAPVMVDGFALMNLRFTDDGEIIANHSTYDFSSDGTGHTWKIYWYYYSESEGKFIQYDAVDITEAQFKEYSGSDEALEHITGDSAGYTPVRYLLFENGIICVNCVNDSNSNYHFVYRISDDGSLTDITGIYGEFNEGHYITLEDYKNILEGYHDGL